MKSAVSGVTAKTKQLYYTNPVDVLCVYSISYLVCFRSFGPAGVTRCVRDLKAEFLYNPLQVQHFPLAVTFIVITPLKLSEF